MNARFRVLDRYHCKAEASVSRAIRRRREAVDCALTHGFVVSGTGEYNYDEERLTLEESVTGAASGDLVYTREGDGSLHVTGVFDGEPVELSE